MFGAGSGRFGLVDAGVLLVGEKFEVFKFVEVVFLFGLEAWRSDDFVLVGLHQGRYDVADVHGIVLIVVFWILLRFGPNWQVIILLALGLVDQWTLLPLLLLLLLLQHFRLPLRLYFEQVIQGGGLVMSVIQNVGPGLLRVD